MTSIIINLDLLIFRSIFVNSFDFDISFFFNMMKLNRRNISESTRNLYFWQIQKYKFFKILMTNIFENF